MAGIIVADTIQSGGDFIRLNSASQTVATINVRGIYANTGNLLIAANGTIGVASITNTAITGTMTQAQIGSNVVGKGILFKAKRTSNQSISGGVYTKIQCGSEIFDTDSCYDPSTNFRFTPTVAGYYFFNSIVTISAYSNRQTLYIYKNGAVDIEGFSNTGNGTNDDASMVAGIAYANGTSDYFELYIQGNNSATVTSGFFEGYLIRAT